ncbi:hypothetical protein CC78DRAFT_161438 [Lojkania enalia]|uniref:Uncharacterized protein n=1 Tax=Lojkania enalia TaxID=147567 RepID=A0A9P4N4U5_9PLEO|nr:hypothetical protein CC78DRAFT_161438 [Didymosphaeria enalia]
MPPTQVSAFHPSPKRKRDTPYIPLLDTTLHSTSAPQRDSLTPDSPRNVVADQLRGMTIAAMPMSPLTPDDVIHKKPKLEFMREDSAASLEDSNDTDARTSQKEKDLDSSLVRRQDAAGPKEISDTPQPYPQALPPRPRTLSDFTTFAQPTVFASSASKLAPQQPATSGSMSRSKNRSSEPRPRKKSPSPPTSSLTWQDSEITGHLTDPSIDPEDDGTGLNGIGFKPTPALAYARAQKRRQQLIEWRARESRDARAKRSERRRRGIRANSREGTVERESIPKETDARRV